MSATNLTITPFERRYQDAVDRLIFHNYQVHTHLDWFEPHDWLNRFPVPVRLAWQNRQLVGLMALSNPLNGGAWLRIVALHDRAPAYLILKSLWEDMLPELHALGVGRVSVLIARSWIKSHLRDLQFRFAEDVITLQRSSQGLPDPPETAVQVRGLYPDDLKRVTEVDQAAFSPPWQMTIEEIREAQRVAQFCTVAEHEGQILGFQISTFYQGNAHLARLAVDPQCQGQGVGSALLYHMLRRCQQQRMIHITVNTQAGNLRSQRLYRRFGFLRNSYDLPVWSLRLSG